MLFNSYTFLIFFAVVLFVSRLRLPWAGKKLFLLVMSYLFYAAWNPAFCANHLARCQSRRHGVGPLLPKIDVARNAASGHWEMQKEQLRCTPGRLSRIDIPVAIRGSYEIEMEFTRTRGQLSVHLVLPAGRGDFDVVLSAVNPPVGGLQMIRGKYCKSNPTKTPSALTNGKRYRLRVKVVLEKAAGVKLLAAWLNDKPYAGWEGPQAALRASGYWTGRTRQSPSIGAHEIALTVHSLRYRALAGGKSGGE